MGRHRKRVRKKDDINSDEEKFEHTDERMIKRKRKNNKEIGDELKGTSKVDKNQKRKLKQSRQNEAKHKYKERGHKKSNKRRQKDSKNSKHSSKHMEQKERILPAKEELCQRYDAGDCEKSRIRKKVDRYDRLEEINSGSEDMQSPPADDLDVSLMSRRMKQFPSKNSKSRAGGKQKNNSKRLRSKHNDKSFEKLKMTVKNVMEDNFMHVVGAIQNCTERICKSSHIRTKDHEKHVYENVRKITEKENSESRVLFEEKISNNQTFIKRCRLLEKQLTSSEARCKQLAKDASRYKTAKREHKALEGEFKIVCEHNSALQTELSEVKQKFQEQLTDKTAEIDRLKEVRNSLTIKAKEFRLETEKSLKTQSVNHNLDLNKIREQHAKEISKLQVQCSDLTISNLDLKKRNEGLMKILKDNQIDSPVFVNSVVATPERGASADLSKTLNEIDKEKCNTPYSGDRKELYKLQCAKSSSKEISMLKADIASLRVSLETKSTQVSELWKIYNMYAILTGLRITKNELFFECQVRNPEEKVEFLFSLICQDNGSSILYEKNSWKSDRECPCFLNDCSGQFFDCKVAPLFLKNVLMEIFSLGQNSRSVDPGLMEHSDWKKKQ